MNQPNQPPATAPDYLEVGEYCADVLMQEMKTRRGFIELLEQIDPEVKKKMINHWGGLIAVAIRWVAQNDPILESIKKQHNLQK